LVTQTAQFFEETHWEKAAKTRMGKYLTRLETDFILKTVDPKKVSFAVDMGTEAGRFSLFAAKSDVSVVGLDLDAYSLLRLKKKNRDVPVVQADARKTPLKNDTFDAVFMIEVLDYIPELAEAFSESNRILKRGASLVLSFGNQSSLKAKLRGMRGKFYLHSYGEVMKYLKESGFEVTAKMGYNWLPLGRISESPFVRVLAGLEKAFGLRKLPSLSPWVILHATKSI